MAKAIRGGALAAAAVCAAGVMAAACGSGSGGPASDPTPPSVPEATIDGSTFSDPAGYQVTIPAGWTADDNAIVFGRQTTDAFYATETIGDIQTNIAVTCEQLPAEGATLDAFATQYASTLAELQALDTQTSAGPQIGGYESRMFTYRLERNDRNLRKKEFLVVAGRCAWTVSLLRAASAPMDSEAALDELVRSLRFLE